MAARATNVNIPIDSGRLAKIYHPRVVNCLKAVFSLENDINL